MGQRANDQRLVSISALITALRRQYVTDPTIRRVLVEALGIDDATARTYAEGHPAAPEPAPITDRTVLHEMLADAESRKDWAAVVTLVARIAELETDPRSRARFLYTVATVQRTELKDVEGALESYEQALDCDPAMLKAFEGIKRVLAELGDWKRLEREHRKMIVRTRDRGDQALELALFHALAAIYRDHLGHKASAIEAFRAALQLKPDDADALAGLRELGVDV